MKQKKTSLVTGAAGFMGSHVADQLLKLGHRVICLDDLSGGYSNNVPDKTIFVKASILDEKLLDRIFKKYKPDFVYHLAAYAAEGLSHFIRKFNYENNLVGSINLINRSILYSVKHFVFTSSIAVYGANQTPMTEKLTPQPEDPYGISKLAVEYDLKNAHEMFGLTYTVFRPHNVYGERQNLGDPYRNVIGIFMNNIMKELPMTIFGDGQQTRAFTHIDDVAPHIAKSTNIKDAQNQLFNIGADKPYSVLKLAHVIADKMGVSPNISYLPPRLEVVDAYSDHTKVQKVFKMKPKITLEDGISRMAKWARKMGPMKPTKFKHIEVSKNMPPSWLKLTQ